MRVVFVSLAILAGCAQWQPFRAERRPSAVSTTELTARAAKVLTADGFTVTSAVDGLVITEWGPLPGSKPVLNSDAKPALGRWTITVQGGEVVVDLQCRLDDGGSCGDKRPPGDWQARAADIADRITH